MHVETSIVGSQRGTDVERPVGSQWALKMEKQPRLRVCSTCHKTFKRTEHCVRHERARTWMVSSFIGSTSFYSRPISDNFLLMQTCELDNRERPFSCRFCERSYGRK